MKLTPPSLHHERESLPLWLPVAFGLGIILYFSLSSEPSSWQTSSFMLLAIGSLLLTRKRLRKLLSVSVALITMALGFANAHWHASSATSPIIADDLGTVWVRGEVESIEEQEHGYRIYLTKLDLWRPDVKKFPPEETPKRARISIRTPMEGVNPGDYVGFRAILSPPPRFPAYPGGYNFARVAYFQHIGAVGFSLSEVKVREPALRLTLNALRHTITNTIIGGFSADAPTAHIATALLTGERGAIDKKVLNDIYASGLGHLLAISGLHLAMVMAGWYFFLRAGLALWPYIALRYPIKKWAAGMALLTGFIYLLLAGTPIPAQRAYIMAGLFFLAILLDRTGTPMRPVAWAAFIVLLVSPQSILTPSFQMSFAAVTGLIAAFGSIRIFRRSSLERTPLAKKILFYILALMLSSVVAGLVTSPFAIYHFGRYSNYGLLANMLAIPLTTFWIMPWGMASLLLMPLGLEGLALALMGVGLDALVKISSVIANMENANIMLPHIEAWVIGLFAFGGLWLALWKTRLRLFGLPLMFAALLAILFPPNIPNIWVEEDGKLIAVKDTAGNLVFSSLVSAKYERGRWLEYAGQKKPIHMRDSDALTCDDTACHYSAKGYTATFLSNPEELSQHCKPNLALFVNLKADTPCTAATHSITYADLKAQGTHVVWLHNDLKILSSGAAEGTRLWTAPR